MTDGQSALGHRLRQARRAVVDAVTNRGDGNQAADPVLGSHLAGTGEILQRTPDREPVHAVLRRQLRLGRQSFSRPQLRPLDAGEQVLGDLPVQRSSRLL